MIHCAKLRKRLFAAAASLGSLRTSADKITGRKNEGSHTGFRALLCFKLCRQVRVCSLLLRAEMPLLKKCLAKDAFYKREEKPWSFWLVDRNLVCPFQKSAKHIKVLIQSIVCAEGWRGLQADQLGALQKEKGCQRKTLCEDTDCVSLVHENTRCRKIYSTREMDASKKVLSFNQMQSVCWCWTSPRAGADQWQYLPSAKVLYFVISPFHILTVDGDLLWCHFPSHLPLGSRQIGSKLALGTANSIALGWQELAAKSLRRDKFYSHPRFPHHFTTENPFWCAWGVRMQQGKGKLLTPFTGGWTVPEFCEVGHSRNDSSGLTSASKVGVRIYGISLAARFWCARHVKRGWLRYLPLHFCQKSDPKTAETQTFWRASPRQYWHFFHDAIKSQEHAKFCHSSEGQ